MFLMVLNTKHHKIHLLVFAVKYIITNSACALLTINKKLILTSMTKNSRSSDSILDKYFQNTDILLFLTCSFGAGGNVASLRSFKLETILVISRFLM